MVEQDERSKLYRLSIDFIALAAEAVFRPGSFPSKSMSIDEFLGAVKKQVPEAAELVRASGAKLE